MKATDFDLQADLEFDFDTEMDLPASGWCTAFFGKPLLAIEPECGGKGDDHCEWKIRPPDAGGEEAKPYLEALHGLLG